MKPAFFDFLFKSRKETALPLRPEDILSALPGEYCAWTESGAVLSSPGFCALLDIETVTHLADIQRRLAEPDAAVLGERFHAMRDTGDAFNVRASSQGGKKSFEINGYCGKDRLAVLCIQSVHTPDIQEGTESKSNLTEGEALDHEKLHDIVQTLPHPAWLRDEHQKLIWCNARYAESFKSTLTQIIEEQKEFTSASKKKKDDAPVAGKALAQRALQNGKTEFTKMHVIVAGNRLLMRISETPLPEQKLTLGLAEDITDQEDMEQSLARHKTANEELLEQLHTAIGVYDSNYRLEFYNSAYSALWGLEEQWLNSRPKLGEIMEKLRETRRLPEQTDFRDFKQSWLDMFTNLIEPHDEMLHLPDGSALRMLAVPNPNGGLMMTFEDVSSRLELESSYNTLIAVQKETLDNLAEAVAVFGGDGRLKLWNPAYGRVWGLNPEDLEGEPHISKIVEKFKPLFTEEEWPEQKEDLIALALDRVMHEGRHELDNGVRLDYSTVPLPDGGVLITYSDVTDTVRVETALREKNKALETAEKLKLDFLANVSYQLRTPLNAIMGFNEILDQEYFGPLNNRQKEYTNDTKQASMRLLNLINDILDLSTIEAGYLSLEPEDVKIRDMLESLVDLVSEWSRKERIEVSLSCPKNIGSIRVDGQRIKQALMNIIRNSISYTPAGGKIVLSAKRGKDGITLAVQDTGIGIDEKDRMRILQPFERAHAGLKSGPKEQSGAGLGLSLVNNIVALHGGHMNLESEKGKGTTVTLFIPFEADEQKERPKTAQSI